MKKTIYLLTIILAVIFMVPTMEAKAATKTYTITEDTQAPAKYKKLNTYNSKTKTYYAFRHVFEQCTDNGGGKIIIKKGDYSITNPIYISSNTTVILEDGVTITKALTTGTSKLKASMSIFQLINYKYAKTKDHYKGYSGEHDIKIIGQGTATMNVNYFERGLAIIIGHSKNITIKNIHFKNLYAGHFIEIDACKDSIIDGCTFENAKPWGSDFKEAINVDTPDLATRGFNSIWSSHDKTPDKNIRFTNCTFKNLDSAIGTHSASKTKNPKTGLYDVVQWHTDIKVDNCKFINITRTALRIYAWKDAIIENNEFTNEIAYKSCGIIECWLLDNPTIKNNTFNNFYKIGYILALSYYNIKDGKIVKVAGQDYEPNYSRIYEQNIQDLYTNKAINMDNATLLIEKSLTNCKPDADITISGSELK